MYDTVQAIINSHWSTADLAAFALNWYETSPAIIAGTQHAAPIWKTIGVDETSAHEYYARLRDEDPDELRSEAALALAGSGWDIRKINYKKS